MSQPPTENTPADAEQLGPDDARPDRTDQAEAVQDQPAQAPARLPRKRSALALAALAGIAVPGLDPARLALPQEESADLRVVGVIDTRGRHWEVLEARDDDAGASLEAEAEVLRRISKVVDEGRLSFDVPRPAGSLRRPDAHVQVRTHLEGHPLDVSSLRPGPGLSAGLGRALGELHELSTDLLADSGMPVYDAEEVRQRWLSLLDDAAGTGKVPAGLLTRWELALENTTLWRFRSVVVHGDLAEENVLTTGGAVTAFRGLSLSHVGDPAEDMAWIYSSAPVDCLDSIESAYDAARTEGVDKYLRERAELASEMSLARWLLHGVRAESQAIVDDAVAMLHDLADQVGEGSLVEPAEPHLAAVEDLPEHLGDEEGGDADAPTADPGTLPENPVSPEEEGARW